MLEFNRTFNRKKGLFVWGTIVNDQHLSVVTVRLHLAEPWKLRLSLHHSVRRDMTRRVSDVFERENSTTKLITPWKKWLPKYAITNRWLSHQHGNHTQNRMQHSNRILPTLSMSGREKKKKPTALSGARHWITIRCSGRAGFNTWLERKFKTSWHSWRPCGEIWPERLEWAATQWPPSLACARIDCLRTCLDILPEVSPRFWSAQLEKLLGLSRLHLRTCRNCRGALSSLLQYSLSWVLKLRSYSPESFLSFFEIINIPTIKLNVYLF